MFYLYFVYGLAFFTMGLAILSHPRHESDLPIAKSLGLVGCFGVLHACNEWAELFSLLPGSEGALAVQVTRLICLPASFLCLLAFGLCGVSFTSGSRQLFGFVLGSALAAWVAIVATSSEPWRASGVWARYLMGLSGSLLTAAVFARQRAPFARFRPLLALPFGAAAAAFALYGVLAGTVVPEAPFFPASVVNTTSFLRATGIPIQVARTVCALAITASVLSILHMLTWETREKLRSLSLVDDLTGLLNRRGFFTLVEQQLKIARRHGRNAVLLIGDMDGFKAINDACGHAAGDAALMEMAAIFRSSFRESDIIARIGGDEFAILQVDSTNEDAEAAIARLRSNLAVRNNDGSGGCALAISLGAVQCDPLADESIDGWLARADADMYANKNATRHPGSGRISIMARRSQVV